MTDLGGQVADGSLGEIKSSVVAFWDFPFVVEADVEAGGCECVSIRSQERKEALVRVPDRSV